MNDVTLTPADYSLSLRTAQGQAVLTRQGFGAKLSLTIASLKLDAQPSASIRLAVAQVVQLPGSGGGGNSYFPGGW